MEDEYVTEKELFELLDESEEILLDSFPDVISEIDRELSKQVVINSRLSTSWSGVRSCCDSARAQRLADRELIRWVNQMKKEHSDMRYLRHDASPKSFWRCKNRRNRWTGKRSCNGWAVIYASIYFAK